MIWKDACLICERNKADCRFKCGKFEWEEVKDGSIQVGYGCEFRDKKFGGKILEMDLNINKVTRRRNIGG